MENCPGKPFPGVAGHAPGSEEVQTETVECTRGRHQGNSRGSYRGDLFSMHRRRYVQFRLNEPNDIALPDNDLIEKLGIHFEQHALPRIAGRIFGLLLLSVEPLSLDQIAEQLHVSRASVSVDARRLAHLGIIQQTGQPGDRRKYYKIAVDSFARAMRLRLQSIRDFHSLIASAADSKANRDDQIHARLADFEAGSREIIRLLEAGIASNCARSHQTQWA